VTYTVRAIQLILEYDQTDIFVHDIHTDTYLPRCIPINLHPLDCPTIIMVGLPGQIDACPYSDGSTATLVSRNASAVISAFVPRPNSRGKTHDYGQKHRIAANDDTDRNAHSYFSEPYSLERPHFIKDGFELALSVPSLVTPRYLPVRTDLIVHLSPSLLSNNHFKLFKSVSVVIFRWKWAYLLTKSCSILFHSN
jgi:hypothetical protein